MIGCRSHDRPRPTYCELHLGHGGGVIFDYYQLVLVAFLVLRIADECKPLLLVSTIFG